MASIVWTEDPLELLGRYSANLGESQFSQVLDVTCGEYATNGILSPLERYPGSPRHLYLRELL